uniref:Uncharacterized protein n=1 Tax=Oryza glumipatula TaxID=40148 RepID=A0A0E0BV76_9ORYZ
MGLLFLLGGEWLSRRRRPLSSAASSLSSRSPQLLSDLPLTGTRSVASSSPPKSWRSFFGYQDLPGKSGEAIGFGSPVGGWSRPTVGWIDGGEEGGSRWLRSSKKAKQVTFGHRMRTPEFRSGAIPDGPVMYDRHTSAGPPIDKPEVPNEVLLPEAVPSGLHKHGVEAWVEFPHRALVHHQDRCEVWDDGGLAAAHPSAGSTVGCAVDALAVGVAASHIQIRVAVHVATDDAEGMAADGHEAVAGGGGDERRTLQGEPCGSSQLPTYGVFSEVGTTDALFKADLVKEKTMKASAN